MTKNAKIATWSSVVAALALGSFIAYQYAMSVYNGLEVKIQANKLRGILPQLGTLGKDKKFKLDIMLKSKRGIKLNVRSVRTFYEKTLTLESIVDSDGVEIGKGEFKTTVVDTKIVDFAKVGKMAREYSDKEDAPFWDKIQYEVEIKILFMKVRVRA
jgi:hypothetical protein